MELYIVSTQTFFKENGIEYAMPVDLDDDLKHFSDYSNAVNEYNSIINNLRNNFMDHEKEIVRSSKNLGTILYNRYETVSYVVKLTSKEAY